MASRARAVSPKAATAAGTHVAFLRGINVGRAKRIAMADLRGLVERLGYGGVRTLLNSGNVVFAARAADQRDHAARIEKAIEQELGLTSRVTVLDAAALSRVVAENTLYSRSRDPARLHVTVFRERGDRDKLVALARTNWSPEAIAVGRHAAYLWLPGGMIKSALATAMARALQDGITTRNWATLNKLHAMFEP